MKLNKLIPSDRFVLKQDLNMDPIHVYMVADAPKGSSLKKEAGKVLAVRIGYHGHGYVAQLDSDIEVVQLD